MLNASGQLRLTTDDTTTNDATTEDRGRTTKEHPNGNDGDKGQREGQTAGTTHLNGYHPRSVPEDLFFPPWDPLRSLHSEIGNRPPLFDRDSIPKGT
jgi:hypothetical protein